MLLAAMQQQQQQRQRQAAPYSQPGSPPPSFVSPNSSGFVAPLGPDLASLDGAQLQLQSMAAAGAPSDPSGRLSVPFVLSTEDFRAAIPFLHDICNVTGAQLSAHLIPSAFHVTLQGNAEQVRMATRLMASVLSDVRFSSASLQ